MKLKLGYRNNIFILGAGSSREYGLPVWKELQSLIEAHLRGSDGVKYTRAKDILNWMGKVGDKEFEYRTIDECIAKESISETYYSDGDSVEDELFSVIKNIFNGARKENRAGWITKLNDKILRQPVSKPETNMAFVSYNYDNILEGNFLKFEHLPGKHQRLNDKPRLVELTETTVPVLYAHGNLYSKTEISDNSHTKRYFKTMKSGNANYIDVVSCHESDDHTLEHELYAEDLKLYILGLGGGLKFNLKKLKFDKKISEISITISDEKNEEDIVKFLTTNFRVPIEKIFVYKTCTQLIEDRL